MWPLKKEVVRHAWLSLMRSKTCYVDCLKHGSFNSLYSDASIGNSSPDFHLQQIESDKDHTPCFESHS